MILCRVVGEVWGTRKVPNLDGLRLLEVDPLDAHLRPTGSVLVAADRLGAGPGEHVVVAESSRARDIVLGQHLPVKAFVLAIVDGAEANGRTLDVRHPGVREGTP